MANTKPVSKNNKNELVPETPVKRAALDSCQLIFDFTKMLIAQLKQIGLGTRAC